MSEEFKVGDLVVYAGHEYDHQPYKNKVYKVMSVFTTHFYTSGKVLPACRFPSGQGAAFCKDLIRFYGTEFERIMYDVNS